MTLGLFKNQSLPPNKQATTKLSIKDLSVSLLAPMSLIIFVLGSIFMGIATPTEASAIGAFGALVLAFAQGKLTKAVVRESCLECMKTTAFIFAIIIGASCFSLVLRSLGGDEIIESLLRGLNMAPHALVLCLLLIVFVLGFFLDWIEITLIILPFVAPVIENLSFHWSDLYAHVDQANLVWFAILIALTLQSSFLTPPVGFALFYIKGIAPRSVKLGHIYRGVLPFVLLQLLAVLIVLYFPQLVLWLPEKMFGS